MKKIVMAIMAVFIVLAFLLLAVGVTPAHAGNDDKPVHKSYVCKYVGKPGVDERLQMGNNPIWVDNHALGVDGPTYVGQEFNDGQGKSVVIVANTPKLKPEPTVSDCPAPEGPTEPTPTPTPEPTPSEPVDPTPPVEPTPTVPVEPTPSVPVEPCPDDSVISAGGECYPCETFDPATGICGEPDLPVICPEGTSANVQGGCMPVGPPPKTNKPKPTTPVETPTVAVPTSVPSGTESLPNTGNGIGLGLVIGGTLLVLLGAGVLIYRKFPLDKGTHE